MKSKSGFTVVEMLTVVVVIALLVSIVSFTYRAYFDNSRDVKRNADVRVLDAAMTRYFRQNGNYPVTCWDNSTFGVNCSSVSAPYTGGSYDAIAPSSTLATLKQFMPSLQNDFGDPRRQATAKINLVTANVVQPGAYFLLSPDITTGSGSITFRGPSGNFTCQYNATGQNMAQQADANRPHNFIIGYAIENGTWLFAYNKASHDQNVLRWNTNSTGQCNARELGDVN